MPMNVAIRPVLIAVCVFDFVWPNVDLWEIPNIFQILH